MCNNQCAYASVKVCVHLGAFVSAYVCVHCVCSRSIKKAIVKTCSNKKPKRCRRLLNYSRKTWNIRSKPSETRCWTLKVLFKAVLNQIELFTPKKGNGEQTSFRPLISHIICIISMSSSVSGCGVQIYLIIFAHIHLHTHSRLIGRPVQLHLINK